MSNKGEIITEERIGFEKSNKALGYIYKEWYEIISKQLSEIDGINIELGCGASFIKVSYRHGGGGIRTHGALADTLVFKTRALNHSTTPPEGYSVISELVIYITRS